MVEILEEVAAVARTERIPRLEALHFVELNREYVLGPVINLRDSREFLEIVRDREILELFEFEIDGLQARENPAGTSDVTEDLVKISDLVVVRLCCKSGRNARSACFEI